MNMTQDDDQLRLLSILVLSRESVKKQFLPNLEGGVPRQAGEPVPPLG
jgi:hypothetical protein